MSQRPTASGIAERVVAADPAQVWALVANPDRLAEWSGAAVVGYMGTELPKPGHVIFVRRRFPGAKPRRVEIESWDAGTEIRCRVHTRWSPTSFALVIHSEVEPERIATRIRLRQQSDVSSSVRSAWTWWTERQLGRMLDRIEAAVTA